MPKLDQHPAEVSQTLFIKDIIVTSEKNAVKHVTISYEPVLTLKQAMKNKELASVGKELIQSGDAGDNDKVIVCNLGEKNEARIERFLEILEEKFIYMVLIEQNKTTYRQKTQIN